MTPPGSSATSSTRTGPAQLAGSKLAQPQQDPFPQTMGPGLPDVVQPFPSDFAALQQMMQVGYAPGANDQQHAQAQNAHALARAQERQAQAQLADAEQEQVDMMQLQDILQRVSLRRGATQTGSAGTPAGGASS